MNKPKPVLNKLYLLLFVFIALTAIIIESCKKDNHAEQQAAVTDPAIAQAKTWYESTYPVNTNKVTTQANGTNSDLSQIIKPDWQHNASYSRFNKKVIELPLDPSSKFNPAIKNMTTGRSSNSAYSRSSFILINNGSGYEAYVMTLIADSAYLKNDRSKLDRNKYNKRDADYSGLVLYFTPNGKYIGGWRYKDGHLVVPGNPGSSSGAKVQSLGTSKLKPMYEDCYAFYLVNLTDGWATYLYTLCFSGADSGDIGTDPNGGGGSGPGDGGPSSTTPPPPCNDAVHPGPAPMINSSGKLTVNDVPPDGGDGFPPPTGPCYVETPEPKIIDSIGKKYPCTGALIASLPNLNTNIAHLISQAFNKTNNDVIFLEGDPAYFATNTNEDGYTLTDKDNSGLTSKVYINPAILANSTNEYRLVTLYHEALHAFLASEHDSLTPDQFAAKYPEVNVFPRQNFSQVVNADKYDYYIDPAYQTKIVGKDHLTMADYFVTGLKDAILAYNPSFSPDRALALAQTGIIQNKTELFNNYNDAERDATKGTSVGHKCTP
jgi:hypothetical protein